MQHPGRNGNKYRFGFNGMEMDDEVSGTGNIYDYGFRIYNPRTAKFLSVDPLTKDYPMLTPYQYASNNPIMNIDIDGLEGTPADKKAAYRTLTIAIQKYAYYDVAPNLYADKYYPVGHNYIIQSEQSKTECSHLENNKRNPKFLKSLSDHNLIKATFSTDVNGSKVVGELKVVVPLAQKYSKIGYISFTNLKNHPDGENLVGNWNFGASGVDKGYYIRFYNHKPNEVDNPIEFKEIGHMYFKNKEDFLKFKKKHYHELKKESLKDLEDNKKQQDDSKKRE